VSAFKEMVDQQPKLMKGWKLILVGPVEDVEYAQRVKELAKGYPIELCHSLSRTELLKQYQLATFYWHAAGFEVNELTHPEKVEHFGISTVEAMNFGCIPLSVGKGGQIEVLGSSLQNLAWQKIEELTKMTIFLIENERQRYELAEKAVTQAKNFGKDAFVRTLREMIT
jgi:glycosyltransferase involved in cell wall biosynthesis